MFIQDLYWMGLLDPSVVTMKYLKTSSLRHGGSVKESPEADSLHVVMDGVSTWREKLALKCECGVLLWLLRCLGDLHIEVEEKASCEVLRVLLSFMDWNGCWQPGTLPTWADKGKCVFCQQKGKKILLLLLERKGRRQGKDTIPPLISSVRENWKVI